MKREDLLPSVQTQAERFAALFDGRKDAYGVNAGGVRRVPDSGIWNGLYRRHVEGSAGIGVFPVRDNNTVKFAAIDLDEPDFDLAVEMAKLLPGHVWIERSRSGNAHVWTFFREPCPAWAARAVLRNATFSVGEPTVEVFPKQSELREGMVGNYINLPYFGGTRPMIWQTDDSEYGFNAAGTGYLLPAFLHDAEPRLNDPEEWLGRARAMGAEPPGARQPREEFGSRSSLHICATYMLENKDTNPLRDGHRHVVLFNLAKMLLNCQEYDESEALLALEGFNDASTAPLGQRELEQIVANAARGGWTSTGCDDPLMADYVHPECPIANA
jgi:hypothetical protein